MQLRGFFIVCLLLWLGACKREEAGVHFFAEGQPGSLSEWRVLKVKDGRLTLNQGVTPYDLNTPLFSDYALKQRYLFLPPGTAVRYTAQGAFDFPVGTIVSKTL